MNRIYRNVWNEVTRSLVAAETVQAWVVCSQQMQKPVYGNTR